MTPEDIAKLGSSAGAGAGAGAGATTVPLADKVEVRRAPILTFELANATDGCEIRTHFNVLTTSGGDAVPSLAAVSITLPVLRELGGLLVRRVREPVLTSKNIQVRVDVLARAACTSRA